MGIAPRRERLKNAHHDFMKVINNAAPLNERFSNVHHGFMKAFVQLFVFMSFANHKKNVSPLYERFNNVQHGFMKALKKNVNLPFHESSNNLHHDL